MLIVATIVLIIAYILIAWEVFPKVTIALLGASIMLVIQHAPAEKVFSHIDFAVIFLLIGMMIIVHITSRSGVFNWLGIEILKHTKGKPKRILVAIAFLTAFLSAFLDNVTTVVLVLPIIYQIAKQLEKSPIPYLITAIIASNIGGTATLIGDPPNIIIGTAAGLSFMDFLRELSGVVFVIFLVVTCVLLIYYRKELRADKEHARKITLLDNTKAITDMPLMIRSLVVLFLVIAGFIMHSTLHIDAYIFALFGASILMLSEKPKQILHEVEWTTIFFFIGLFIIIGGFAEAGGIRLLAEKTLAITKGNTQTATFLILWVSGLLSAVIDNIPYTITMTPLIKELKTVMDVQPLWWSLSLGACLGGNATIIGAAANVIVADSAHHKGYSISFFEYMKIGVIVTVVSLIISTVYLYLRFFV